MKRFKVLGFNRRSCYAQGEFCKRYEKDEIVAAVPGALGIMTFKSFEDAEEFKRPRGHRCIQIVAVKPIGRGKAPKKISGISEPDMERFYEEGPKNGEWSFPPKGTICYPAVRVLEW